MNYETAKELMSTARNPTNGKPLKNNTRLYQVGDNYEVRLHDSPILTITPTTFILNSCGWKTLTTKDRLNQFGFNNSHHIRIVQRKFKWYVEQWSFITGEYYLTEFYDTMVWSHDSPHLRELGVV